MSYVRKLDPELEIHLAYVYGLTREFQKRWRSTIANYVEILQRDIPLSDIDNAVDTGDATGLVGRLSWLDADEQLRADAGQLAGEVAIRAGNAELTRLNISLRMDIDNPYVARWVEQHAAELVVQVTPETQKAIRVVIQDAFVNADPPRRAAMRVRGLIGLTERDARAVLSYWRTLAEEGLRSARRADEMADVYANKLLRRRAENVSRTETINAASAGQQLSWQDAQGRGLLLPETRQEWIAAVESTRTCSRCLAMDGQKVPVGQPFMSDVGPISGPTLHPSCRCAVSIVTEIPD